MDITSAPREASTIAGETFQVAKPFAEGASLTLTAGLASTLNQVFAENVRNNFAAKVKAAKEAGAFDLAAFQGQLDTYMGEYEFGVRRGGGGRTSDPVAKEALSIVRDLVKAAYAKKGATVSDKDVTAKAKELLANVEDPKIAAVLKEAKRRVSTAASIASEDLDLGQAA